MSDNNIIEQAIRKLDEESKARPSTKVIAEYLKSKCQTDIELAKNINNKEKSLKGSMDYIIEKAKKQSSGGFSMVKDETVFKWSENYFGIDKPVINENDVNAAAHAVNHGASTTIKDNSSVKKSNTENKKTKNKELDNQVSLFDIL